jgi:hypothetical protein
MDELLQVGEMKWFVVSFPYREHGAIEYSAKNKNNPNEKKNAAGILHECKSRGAASRPMGEF